MNCTHNKSSRTCQKCGTEYCSDCTNKRFKSIDNPAKDTIYCPTCETETYLYYSQPQKEKKKTMLKKQDTNEYIETGSKTLSEFAKIVIANSKKDNGLIWRRFALATYIQNATLSLVNEDKDFNQYIDEYKKVVEEYYSYSHTVPTKLLSKGMNVFCQASFSAMKIGFNLWTK